MKPPAMKAECGESHHLSWWRLSYCACQWFARWSTLTYDQATGTGVLAGRTFGVSMPVWFSFACNERDSIRVFQIAVRADQSARIGFGAL